MSKSRGKTEDVEKGQKTNHIYSAMILSVESVRSRLMRSVSEAIRYECKENV